MRDSIQITDGDQKVYRDEDTHKQHENIVKGSGDEDEHKQDKAVMRDSIQITDVYRYEDTHKQHEGSSDEDQHKQDEDEDK